MDLFLEIMIKNVQKYRICLLGVFKVVVLNMGLNVILLISNNKVGLKLECDKNVGICGWFLLCWDLLSIIIIEG